MVDTPAVRNGLKKLAESGITLEDAKELGMKFLTGAEVQRLCPAFKDLTAIGIYYFDLDGKPLEDTPGGGHFVRCRYTAKPNDFSSVVGKPPRYVQLPNTLPVAYFPRCFKEWREIAQDPTRPIIITEGEFKAAKATLMGFPTIGLGGVFNWRALKAGVPWIASLGLIDWRRRHVILIWDSDWRRNPQVCQSLTEFATMLESKGAIVYVANLPEYEEGTKVGLDDFIMHEGAGAVEAMQRLLQSAEAIGLARPLWGLNKRFIYAEDPGMIIDTQTGQKIPPAAFKDHHQSTLIYEARELQKNGTITFKRSAAAPAWLKWPMRRTVNRLTYLPGEPEFPLVNGLVCYNAWKGLAVKPEPGDVTPWLKLRDHVLTGNEPHAIHTFTCWMAYPLQYLGTKLHTALVLSGPKHGTGKSLLGHTMKAIYGQNFAEISTQDLLGNFNGWAENRQFIMGDDIMAGEQRKHGDMLKQMITRPELWVNNKFIPAYLIPDKTNIMLTSNHADAVLLEDDDRRMLVYMVIVDPLPQQFYSDYVRWLHKENGAAHLLHYLLEYDCTGFDPAAPAVRTMARELMIEANKSDVAMWVKQLTETPDVVLRQGEIAITKDLFTSRELLNLYDPMGKTKVTANGIGRELAKLGVRQVYHAKPIKLPSGEQGRYFPIRNYSKWIVAPPQEIVEHLVKWAETQGPRGKKY